MMNAMATNPSMLRSIALQLETLIMSAPKDFPEYLKNSTTQFVSDLKKYAEEMEKKSAPRVTV